MVDLMNNTIEKLKQIKLKENFSPIRIGLIGEIYTIIEPFVNLEIERKLGHMGVLVEKSLSPTKWIDHHVKKISPLVLKKKMKNTNWQNLI